jgi:formate dehydrogenase (coenzyme F420) alpha subunit
VCAICSGTCGMNLTLENGIVVRVEGDKEHPVSKGHLCPKGRAVPELLNAPDRLRHPLIRTTEGQFKEITWDDAIKFFAKRLKEIRTDCGPEALAVHVGQAGVGQESPYYMERFCNLYGTPNFSTSGSHCLESKSMAGFITYGAMPMADYENSRCIVLWGKNPLASSPSLVDAIREARGKGCALIVVDPRETPLAKTADVHLQLRPGTDGALALGILHVVIREGLYDKEFVRTWTVGFDGLVDRIAGYTPEKVGEITGIPAAKVKLAARLYASSSPACISQGVAMELLRNGFQAARAVAILQAVTGNLDVAGGAVFLQGEALSDLRLPGHCGKAPAIGEKEYPLFYKSTGHAQANLYAEAILTGKPYPLKGLVVAGGNPVLAWPNADKVRRALSQLAFLVVIDPFMTETAKLAHLVLPTATFLGRNELWDSSHLSSEPRLGLAPRLCESEGLPTNWEIWKALAGETGYGDHFPWETEEDALNFRLRPFGVTVDDLRGMPAGHVYHRWTPGKYRKEGGFNTPSRKVEIYSAELARYGQDPIPVYHEPAESHQSSPETAASYPLTLTTGARTIEYLHSRFRNLPSLRHRSPDPWVEINPKTAEALSIEDGEMVAVATKRGRIDVKARLTHGILPGVISIPHGWAGANANLLTDDEDLDPVTGFPSDRSLLARIVKIA